MWYMIIYEKVWSYVIMTDNSDSSFSNQGMDLSDDLTEKRVAHRTVSLGFRV